MAAETLLVIFVGVTAVSIVLQAIFVWRTLSSTNHALAKLSSISGELEKDARELMTELHEVVAGLDHLRTVFDSVGEKTEQVNRMFEARTRDVDQLVDKLVQVGTRQAEKVDEVVTDTVVKFEQTTGIIQQDILKPIVEISSIIRGFRTGLDYLFSGKSSGAGGRQAEEDLPI
jgi:uncharacterized protein YoxC